MFSSYDQKLLHVKRLEEYETNTDQLTNLGFGGVVNLPHNESHLAPYMEQDGEHWVLNCKKSFLITNLYADHFHVE